MLPSLPSATMSSSGVIGQPIQETRPTRSGSEGGASDEAMSGPRMSEDVFGALVARVRKRVDAWLSIWLDDRVAAARSGGPAIEIVARAVRDLVLRGGKRLRAGLLVAAFEACGGDDEEAVVAAGASLELFQAYLLVHDDWMDHDDVRRGGPSVPAVMRASFPDKHDAMSVLAGDLAGAWAQQALWAVELPAARVLAAARELASVHEDVVGGQVLDVCGRPEGAGEVEVVHRLKTASYTVRGPVAMGARLAGAGDPQVHALIAFAEPLGVAFQLRDDLLGLFGDARVTGKPAGSDLREGKRTSLVLHALHAPAAAPVVERVLGRADATEAEVEAAVSAISACGARGLVEDRITALSQQALAALGRIEVSAPGRGLLEGAVFSLTARDR
jgi:geranylgeranyl diphosphate synthase type I